MGARGLPINVGCPETYTAELPMFIEEGRKLPWHAGLGRNKVQTHNWRSIEDAFARADFNWDRYDDGHDKRGATPEADKARRQDRDNSCSDHYVLIAKRAMRTARSSAGSAARLARAKMGAPAVTSRLCLARLTTAIL